MSASEAVPGLERQSLLEAFPGLSLEGTWGTASRLTVNYGPGPAKAYVDLSGADFPKGRVKLTDLMSETVYEGMGPTCGPRGFYLEVPAWGFQVFDLSKRSESCRKIRWRRTVIFPRHCLDLGGAGAESLCHPVLSLAKV